MSGKGKRGMVFVADRVAYWTIDSVSKAALADFVVDLLRVEGCGGEACDGMELARLFCERFGPVAAARGDRVPNPDKVAADVAAARERAERMGR